MKLVAVSLVRNEEYWIWYALTSVRPFVDEILLFDDGSVDGTLEIVRSMRHIGDALTVFEHAGRGDEHSTREAMLEEARRHGATHVLFLDGDEVYPESTLTFCRRLLELAEHSPPLNDPPRNHLRARDHVPTDGVLVKHIGLRPIHPGFAGPLTCRPQDHTQPDSDHGCYNYAVRIASLASLHGNGLDWGQHGFLEAGDIYVQSSPHTLWLPRAFYYHMSWHPRSPARSGDEGYGHGPRDFGSEPVRPWVHPPQVLFRPDGPGNPTLEAWGLHRGTPRRDPAGSRAWAGATS
jgi:glycosyltransferase involved in cell wall biosynthesis